MKLLHRKLDGSLSATSKVVRKLLHQRAITGRALLNASHLRLPYRGGTNP